MKTISRFPDYAVNKSGQVFSLISERYLSLVSTPLGYLAVCLRKGGRSSTVCVHRLVLETFVGLCPSGLESRHLNRDRHDNRLRNLCWDTRSSNRQDINLRRIGS